MKLKGYLVAAGFLCIFFLPGCKKPVYNQITEDEAMYLTYMENEHFIFATSGAAIDTYFVTRRDRGYITDKPYYNERATVTFKNFGDTLEGYYEGMIRVEKDKDNHLLAYFVFPHFPKTVNLHEMTPFPIDTINGIVYENVYIATSDPIWNNPYNYINKVYYTKKEGFLKLEDIYGNTWYKIN